MASRTGQSQPIPRLDRSTGVSADIGQVRYATTAPGGIGAFSQAAHSLANSLSGINNKINNRLDKIASEEAKAAGIVKGASGEEITLREAGTISGDAFNASVVRTMQARHDVEARQEADRLYLEHRDNPDALTTHLKAYSNGVQASNIPEVVKAQFDLNFSRLSSTYIRDAALRAESLQQDSDRAAMTVSLEERQKTIEKLAMRAGNDDEAAVMLAQELDSLKIFALEYAPRGAFTLDGIDYPADPTRAGTMSLENIQMQLLQTAEYAKTTRVFGKFMQEPTLQAQVNYAAAFQKEFSDGTGEFDLAQSEQLLSQMGSVIRQKQIIANGQVAVIKNSVDAMQKQMEGGFSPGKENVDALVMKAQASGSPEAVVFGRQISGIFQFHDVARKSSPPELQDWINTARVRLNQSAEEGLEPDPLVMAQVRMGERLLSNMSSELVRDSLSWGARVGLVPLAPLDGTPESAAVRLQAAHTVSAHYNTPLQLLTSEDAVDWKNRWGQGTLDERVVMVSQIQETFGKDAVTAFDAIAEKAPGLGNVGALLASNPSAHRQTVYDYSAGAVIFADGKGKKLPSSKDMAETEADTFGNVYGFSPSAQIAVLDTAAHLYAVRALRQGKASDDFDDDIYNHALLTASGALWDKNGVQHGGIIEQKKDNMIVLPANMTENSFNDLIENLTDNDLPRIGIGGGIPLYSNGRRMTAKEFKDAFLISTGNGRYLISTVNPKTEGQPVFVQGSNPQGLYEIDISLISGGVP